eukprot:CAMPEP_0175657744 /NCGR_PEP_ID=MMETSP0097-20121207/13075_1 /TAXON_ID=311494 /ORGANISM="Alexandrium monilatum, Strain CCMP3105" /LENGTH=46 /DNA_ID= /DNA_START= /DNA_END= /DNA_ORIENTATION=
MEQGDAEMATKRGVAQPLGSEPLVDLPYLHGNDGLEQAGAVLRAGA